MEHLEQIRQLNAILLAEMPEYQPEARKFSQDAASQRRLLRSLMNVRPPMPLKREFLAMQDDLLSAERDNKGVVNQQNFQSQFEKTIDIKHTQVIKGDDIRKEDRKFDAKEKGDNEYYRNGGRQKKKEEKADGKVTVKGSRSFDIKI